MSTTLIVVASATPATILGALAALVPALVIRRRADNDLIEANVAMAKAEELLTEYDRNRNKPWYWPTGPAIKAAPVEPEPEVTADDAVTGEVLAVDGVDTETDAPHDDTNRPRWWATVVAFVVLAPVAFARRQWPLLVAWWRSRRKPVNQPYRGRHWVSDVQHTAEWPVVNPSIPAQRSGDADE